jgi:hypothetical protein
MAGVVVAAGLGEAEELAGPEEVVAVDVGVAVALPEVEAGVAVVVAARVVALAAVAVVAARGVAAPLRGEEELPAVAVAATGVGVLTRINPTAFINVTTR